MKLNRLKASELNWEADFSPRRPWNPVLPILCIENATGAAPQVVAGFERRVENTDLDILILEGSTLDVMTSLYPEESLETFEKLRLAQKLGQPLRFKSLEAWPLAFQNYCDDRRLALKSLQPLQYLASWAEVFSQTCLERNLSSSQLREVIDLLADLNLAGVPWDKVHPGQLDETKWIQYLKEKRSPMTSVRDRQMSSRVVSLPWPKGVHAKWERQGDMGVLNIDVKLSQPREWSRVQQQLQKIEIGEEFWKTEI